MGRKASTNYLRTRKICFPHLFRRNGKRPSRYAPSCRDLLQGLGSNGKHHGQLSSSVFVLFLLMLCVIPRHPEVSHAALPTFSHVTRIRAVGGGLFNQ
jgi:hypothetical protein